MPPKPETRNPNPKRSVSEPQAKRILLVVHSLDLGGAQRVAVTLADAWNQQGEQVAVVTLDRVENDFYRISPRVERVGLDLLGETRWWEKAFRLRQRVRVLRRALRDLRGDVIVSLGDVTNVFTLLAAKPLSVPVIVSERTDPRSHSIGRFWSWMRRRTYPRAAAVAAQTESVRNWLSQWLPQHTKTAVLPNWAPEVDDASSSPSSLKILSVGRLVPGKRHDLLIQAFADIAVDRPEWSLEIIGDGPLKNELQRQIQTAELTSRVRLSPAQKDLADAYRSAAVFASASESEGFPNTLLEAMAYGLPAVCCDCLSGPAEIIRHEMDGLLVENGNRTQFAAALARLMDRFEERRQMARRATEVRRRFGKARILEMWNRLLREV